MITLRHCIAAFPVLLFAAGAGATDVNVIGLFPGKAVVSIDGGPPRTLSAGQKTAEGVTLLSTDRESATLDVGGQRKTLRLGQAYTAAASAGAQTVSLAADTRGHFVVDGQVNGGTVRFLLDTGATMIVLSSADALRLGIDYRKGQPSMMNTANGVAPAYRVKLDSVRVGDITVNSVDAVVMEGGVLPVALLGMSFLNRMQMKRDGQTMVLTKRF
jgi:aspartyl protease family protein